MQCRHLLGEMAGLRVLADTQQRLTDRSERVRPALGAEALAHVTPQLAQIRFRAAQDHHAHTHSAADSRSANTAAASRNCEASISWLPSASSLSRAMACSCRSQTPTSITT